MKATITVGVSGSGKSTWAEQQPNAFEINRDKLRWQVTGKLGWTGENAYKFSSKIETDVTNIAERHLVAAAKMGEDVIISDTNLNPKFRQKLIETCKGLGYKVEIKEFSISFQEAIKRDKNRGIFSVGEQVLQRQWDQWMKYKGDSETTLVKYVPDETKPKAIIVDVDGTIAHMHNRGPFDWKRVGEDHFDNFVGGIVTDLNNQDYKIIFLSGRDGICYSETRMWLDCNFEFPIHELLMRGYKDYRKDSIIKQEIFFRDIAPSYNVHAVIDDRPQVVRMWHEIGIPKVVCVGNPFAEF